MASPLDEYRKQLGGLAVWEPWPGEMSSVHRDLRQLLESNQVQPADWYAFATSSAAFAWQALPADIRTAARNALWNLTADAVSGLQDVGASISAAVGNAAEVLPILGDLIQAVMQIVVGIEKGTKENDRITSDYSYNYALFKTFEQYKRPDQWVAQRCNVINYLAMSSPHVALLFHVRPCMRSTGSADRLWLGSSGPSDYGWCDDGVKVTCPTLLKPGDPVSQCDAIPAKDEANFCKRVSTISALFYPWWNPAYLPNAIRVRGDRETYDLNTLLSARQLALISNPAANLVARGAFVREVVQRISDAWQGLAYVGSQKIYAVLRLSENGDAEMTPLDSRPIIDLSKRPNYVPGQNDRSRFYFRSDGIIDAYSGDDPARWGVALPGPSAQPDLGVSIAAYNAAVAGASAFFRGRAEILRHGPALKAMLQSVKLGDLDPEVKAAVDWVAKQGVVQPFPQIQLVPLTPSRWAKPPSRLGKPKPAPEGMSTPTKVALGAGAAAAGYFGYKYLKKKKVKLPWQ